MPQSAELRNAILLNILATFLLSLMGAFIKHLSEYYPPQEISFFRNLIGMVPTFAILLMHKGWHEQGRTLRIRQWKLALGRGLLVAIAQFFFFLSLANLDLATVSTLVLATPVFLTILSVPILKDQVGFYRWSAVIIGLFGVFLIIRPGSEIFSFIALLPLLAALGYASSGVVVRLIDKNIPVAVMNLYSQTGALAGAFVLMLTTSGYTHVVGLAHWLWIIAMGTVGGLGVYFLTASYRLTKPGNIAPFGYFSIPFSFFLGWTFFDEDPLGTLIPGVFFIILSGLIIIWRDRFAKTDALE